jgi:acyl-homoserine lactone acylase PvdQ
MSLDLNMNMFEEMSRLSLNITGKLTRERISQLWPDYPSDGPLILSSPYPPSSSRTRSKRTQGKFVDTFEHYEKFTPRSPSTSSYSSSSSPWFDVTALLRKNKRFAEFGHFSLLTDSSRASNNWVVSGKLTSTGLPLLANDPHLGFSVPSIWILFHLSSPTFESSGASFAGMPGVVIGRNKDIAWGVTNVGADVQDLYVMIPDPKDPSDSYLTYNEVSHKYVYRTEMIEIKDKEAPFQLVVKETIFGPVVSEIFSKKLPVNEGVALRWTALDGNDTT